MADPMAETTAEIEKEASPTPGCTTGMDTSISEPIQSLAGSTSTLFVVGAKPPELDSGEDSPKSRSKSPGGAPNRRPKKDEKLKGKGRAISPEPELSTYDQGVQ